MLWWKGGFSECNWRCTPEELDLLSRDVHIIDNPQPDDLVEPLIQQLIEPDNLDVLGLISLTLNQQILERFLVFSCDNFKIYSVMQ